MTAPTLLLASGITAILAAVWIASHRIAEAMSDDRAALEGDIRCADAMKTQVHDFTFSSERQRNRASR